MKNGRAIFVDTSMGLIHGGAQVFLARLLPGLAAAGWDVTLVGQGGRAPFAAVEAGRLGIPVRLDVWPHPSLVEDAAPRLASWALGERATVLVISASSGLAWAALPFLHPSIAVLGIVHSDSTAFYRPIHHYRRLITTAVGVSSEITRKLVSDVGLDVERVRRIPYGVEGLSRPEFDIVQRQRRTSGGVEALYIGRLAQPDKRVWDVVSVIRNHELPGVRFRLLGSGPEETEVRRSLDQSTRDGRVTLEGWVSQATVSERCRGAHALLLTSESEGLPIAVLESLAHGIVPVVSDIPACREIVRDGDNGFLVPVGCTDIFAARLAQLAADPGLLARMAERAWETGRGYAIEQMVRDYDRCLSESIAENARRQGDGRPLLGYPLLPTCRSRYPLWLRRLWMRLKR